MSRRHGIFYISGDDHHLQEAIISASSVKQFNSGLKTAIATDASQPGKVFDEVVSVSPSYCFKDKSEHLLKTPFKKTLYLDTDTYVSGSIGDVFEILDRVEIASAHSPHRDCNAMCNQLPQSFPEFNTGVIAYRQSDSVSHLVSTWQEYITKTDEIQRGMTPDQPGFRKAVFDLNISYHTLPPEYNCRSIYPGVLSGPVKIIHGRHDEKMENIATRLNRDETRRIHTQLGNKIRIYDPEEFTSLIHSARVFLYKLFFS